MKCDQPLAVLTKTPAHLTGSVDGCSPGSTQQCVSLIPVWTIKTDPVIELLRNEPRFKAVLAALKFPE